MNQDRERAPETDTQEDRHAGPAHAPRSPAPEGGPSPGGPAGGRSKGVHRPWSARRIPAAVTALVIALVTAVLLFDVVRVRTGGSAAAWRTRLADEVSSRPVDDVWMRVGAVVLVLLGLWLFVLAVTPGLRHKLPLQRADAHVRGVIDRKAAVLLLRDAAMRVPGVSAARVRVGRNRIGVRSDVRFRAPADVKADLLVALRKELDRLYLARRPRINVRARARRT
ncbi:DUF6286 domain-containing protein [Streptomyces sp. cmx-4-9]|uniref:DUF6286 domain-containing protein n=1 Tax=Streptomyces sp. cmx-4-9 TaxID=2790941 RepID=UPI00397EE8FC